MSIESETVNPPEQRNVQEIAQIRLANLGLTLEDLRKYQAVLDIGAKDCIIQRAAINIGLNSVTSVDKKFSDDVKKLGLIILENDARKMEIADSSVDLAIIRSSAYYYTKVEDETWEILREVNRCLKKTGTQRVYPARFGHITAQLLSSNADFFNAKSKSSEQRSKEDSNIIEKYDNFALIESIKFLESAGISVRYKLGLESNAASNFKFYLDIAKF